METLNYARLTEHLDDLVVALNIDWKLHEDLFQNQENAVYLTGSGRGVWSVLNEALIDSVFMGVARLLDPPFSAGKRNLSFAAAVEGVPSEERVHIAGQYEAIKREYDLALREWRNRRLSHNDFETLSKRLPLPEVSYQGLGTLVREINQLARSLGISVRKIDQSYIPVVRNDEWVWKLIRVLKSGLGEV